MNLIDISQQLLKASKTTSSVTSLLNQLEKISLSQLQIELDNDDKRKAFWINIYNAFATIYLKPEPTIILNPIKRKQFFNKKRIQISTCTFSLNDVEHQILRKSKIWWGKGYLKQPFVHPCFKKLRVNEFDARIHFALNCGGFGCPPIRYYKNETINEQLEMATQAFLFSETKKEPAKKQIKISKLFSWYIGDFGGTKGIISFLKKYEIITDLENPKIIYSVYNWEPWIK
tara:strand:- start:5231 stop:5920 length:690 start_codon:yes stop_codon:yes gene_type:complete